MPGVSMHTILIPCTVPWTTSTLLVAPSKGSTRGQREEEGDGLEPGATGEEEEGVAAAGEAGADDGPTPPLWRRLWIN